MVAKRGTKRKANGTTVGAGEALPRPDRNTWPGWVEMESEPVRLILWTCNCNLLTRYQALFNVMLREMGVKGVKIQELYSIDDDMLAILPYVLITIKQDGLLM